MNNVRQLDTLQPERRASLKQFYADPVRFYLDQVNRPEGGAAALHIAVTGEQKMEINMVDVDAAHAAVLLAELDRVRAQLCQFLAEQAPELLEKVNPVQSELEQAGNVALLRKATKGVCLAHVIPLSR